MTEHKPEQSLSPEKNVPLEFSNGDTTFFDNTSRESLKDITRQLEPYIRETGDEGLALELERIQTLFDFASFSVAVAGSFCRGKSTLINRLLETELPTGDLPTTTTLTHIQYGPENKLWYCTKNDDNTFLKKELNAFYSSEEMTPQLAQSGFYLDQIPLLWLDQKRLEFIDTPGMDDTEAFREQLATQAIRSSDAVLIVVGATTPLSISERTYLEEHVYATNIPRIAVVITMIDRIPVHERVTLVENIRYRIQSWYPSAEIWLADGFNSTSEISANDFSVPVGLDAIRSGIDRWACDPEHGIARTNQIRTQLDNLTRLIGTVFETKMNCVIKSSQEKKEIQEALKRKLDTDALQWNDLELEMDRRALKMGTILREQLYSKESEMIRKLQTQLDQAANPAVWWEKDFPFFVSHTFGEIASAIGNSARLIVEEDFRWLNETAQKQTDQWSAFDQDGTVDMTMDSGHIALPGHSDITNLQGTQTMKRIGFAVAGTGAFFLFGPIGPILAATGAYISEKRYKSTSSQQKETIRNEIAKFVPYLLQKISDEATRSIQDKYRNAVIHIRDEKKEWYRVQLDAIQSEAQKESNVDETIKLRSQLEGIKTIQSALKQMNQN